ncbi:MAG: hypothetical protein LKE53_03160 [Oscillospiraceae bacterium]|nr:hypothetical protein [Oscillospiraceae bacterium]
MTLLRKAMTFETQIVDYRYQNIDFSLLFDEFDELKYESFFAVLKSFDW